MSNIENNIYRNTSFSVSRKLFSSIAWKSLNVTERSVLFELLGMACDHDLTLTFETYRFNNLPGEIIATQAYLSELFGMSEEELLTTLNQLQAMQSIRFRNEEIGNLPLWKETPNTPEMAFPHAQTMKENEVIVIQINQTILGKAPETVAEVAPKITPVVQEKAPVAKEPIKVAEAPKSNPEEKILMERFSSEKFPESKELANLYMEKYSLNDEQYRNILSKFCRTKTQSGYLHMTVFMFKLQFDLYIKKNLKHIVG